MADVGSRSVADKLAAAKKKHKAYLKGKLSKNNVNAVNDLQTEDTTTQSNISANDTGQLLSENNEFLSSIETKIENTTEDHLTNVDLLAADLPLPHYSMDHNNGSQSTSLPDPLSFFDNLSNVGATFQNIAQPIASFFSNSNNSHSEHNSIESPNHIVIAGNIMSPLESKPEAESHNIKNVDIVHEAFSYERFQSNALYNVPIDISTNKDVVHPESKEILGNQVFDQFTNFNIGLNDIHYKEISIPDENSFSTVFQSNSNTKEQEHDSNIFQCSKDIDIYKNIQENQPVMFDIKSDMKINTNSDYKTDKNEVNMEPVSMNQSSNLQTLQKISNEMEELIGQDQNLQYLSSVESNEEMEKQNKELLALLDQQNSKCVKLSSQLQESEMKYSKLLTDFRILEIQKEESETCLKLEADIEVQSELSKLREDLQCHLQTIGMLVAEKTELTTLLNETKSALKNESSHCIDLQDKIKEMKHFYSDLEHELEELKNEKLNSNSTQRDQADTFNSMCGNYNELKNRFDELTQDLSQSKEKLRSTIESNLNLQKQVQQLSGQLSLANIKIQQLTLGEGSQQENELEQLKQEKLAYEKQISSLNNTLKTIAQEREESTLQYQQYAEQLNSQITNLAAKLQFCEKENEQLKIQEENRVKHIGDLEKQLQNVKNDSNSFNLQRTNSFLKKELETWTEFAKTLQIKNDELDTNLTKARVDKELLERELEGSKFSINQLETTVEQLSGNQPDHAVLLATMESDKVAASRAISQNNELKKQMESMQEVLLKVNNDNVQLTENVSLERRINKDLLEKLQKTEISYQTLAEAIEIKDKELLNLRDQLEQASKAIVQQEQLSDRLRHYEAQDHSSPSLQNELQDAKQMISHLTNEMNILKKNQLNQTNQMNQTNQIDLRNRNTQTNQNEDGESDDMDVLNELRKQLSNLQIRNKELELILQNFHTTERTSTETNGNENLDKETAMKYLEKKFLRTMEEIARLTEEKQRLEHLVLQLQSETETIGEYVTLYQQQRSILKQRALEKDQQLQQLTNDRESIKSNLNRLNNLVNKLIMEKGAITKELLEQHEQFSKERDDLCAEHQKIHQEINKITSDGLRNSGVSDNSNTEIAEEIIALLSEIKSSNLVQPAEAIHHCPWCSGKLITV